MCLHMNPIRRWLQLQSHETEREKQEERFIFSSLPNSSSLSKISPFLHRMEVPAPRSSRGDSSPEFEFWMVGNHPELESGDIHTADELFVDGVILPLHLLSLTNPTPNLDSEDSSFIKPSSEYRVPVPSASITSATVTASKRWTDIFKKSSSGAEEKEKAKKERRGFSGNNGGSGTELNINIWPFSRSRSAGTGRPKPSSSAASKSSSAPCSRSNSRGEGGGGGRRWAASPARTGGVHVGRASPVWQVRSKAKAGGGGTRKKAGGPRGLNLTVNSCIGYRGHVTCSEEVGGGSAVASTNVTLFRFRGLFTKKVY